MAITFGVQKSNKNLKWLAAVRTWVEDALPPQLCAATVMVNELQCFEPVRCAPSHMSTQSTCLRASRRHAS